MKLFSLLSPVLMLIGSVSAAPVLYVAPQGKVDQPGTKGSPTTLAGAICKLQEAMKQTPKSAPHRIALAGGHYRFEEAVSLGKEIQGSEENPIIIAPIKGAEVQFDGSKPIDVQSFKKVSRASDRARLSKKVADKIYVCTIEDAAMIKLFKSNLMLQLSLNGKGYLPSVFPNEGYALFVEETVTPEMSPPAVPVGKSAYGVRAGHVPYLEEGKKRGFLGSLQEPRGARARIVQADQMAGTWAQWEAELKQNNKRNQMVGYFDADWCYSSMPLYAASEKDSCIHLSRVLAYGWGWRKNDKRFRVFGMLCEVDQEGEWYFDTETHQLFIYPTAKMDNKMDISLSLATGFMKFDGCQYVQAKGLNVKNLATGTAYSIAGEHNLVAGATICRSTASGVRMEGRYNTLLSCDLYDLSHHVSLGGGKRAEGVLIDGKNRVENCHFYQKENKHQKIGVALSGVGNILRNNLIHNSLGQAVTINGNNHLLELNELFNVGYEEGDGGAMYAGGDVTGYGTVYRYNFFHHLMHNPGKVERSAIHLDDMQAGACCYGNIFFKSAGKAIFANGGAAHQWYDNILLQGYRGLFFSTNGDSMYKVEQAIAADPEHSHYIGMKEDYVGRAEKMLGKQFWMQEPWCSSFPLMKEVLSDTAKFGRLWPIRYDIHNNYAYDNRTTKVPDGRVAKEALAKSQIEEYKSIAPSDFVNYEQMDLRFRNKSKFPEIPFEKIGLYQDEYRTNPPNKQKYRRAMREFFKGIKCMPGTKKRIDSAELFN